MKTTDLLPTLFIKDVSKFAILLSLSFSPLHTPPWNTNWLLKCPQRKTFSFLNKNNDDKNNDENENGNNLILMHGAVSQDSNKDEILSAGKTS